MKTLYIYFCVIITASFINIVSCNLISSNKEDGLALKPVKGTESQVEDLIGPTWKLQTFQSNKGDTAKIEEKNKYELTFYSSDSLGGTADCNSFAGTYEARDGGYIKVKKILTTRVYCGSFPTNYQRTLNSKVDSFEVNNKKLKLGFEDKGVILYRKE